jgi:hypothetical protein
MKVERERVAVTGTPSNFKDVNSVAQPVPNKPTSGIGYMGVGMPALSPAGISLGS